MEVKYIAKKLLAIILILIVSSGLLTGCSRSEANTAFEEKLELAVKYLAEQKYDEAILAYQEVIKIDSKNVTAYKGISLAYMLQEKPDQAEQALQDGLKALPENLQLQLAMAGLMADQDKNQQAEAIYKELVGSANPSLSSYQAYSSYLIQQGKSAEAIILLEQAISRNSNDYQLNAMLARVCFMNGEKDKALAAINRSLTIQLDQSASYELLAEMYQGQWADLVTMGDQYIQQKQANIGQLIKMAGLFGMGQYDDVITLYREAATALKDNTRARYIAAQAYSKLGQTDRSLELLKPIKADELKDAGMLAALANHYLESGDKENARKLAMQGINLDETMIDNYLVMYKSYKDEDDVMARAWGFKYVLNSIFSITNSIEEASYMNLLDNKASSENLTSKDIVSALLFSPEEIEEESEYHDEFEERSGYGWKDECYLDSTRNIAYLSYAFIFSDSVMGWTPTANQLRKPVIFRIHAPQVHDTSSVINELRQQFAECFSADEDFEDVYGKSSKVVYCDSFWFTVLAEGVPFEEHLKNAGRAEDTIIFVDIP